MQLRIKIRWILFPPSQFLIIAAMGWLEWYFSLQLVFVWNLILIEVEHWFIFEFDSKLLARKGRAPLYIFRLVRMGPFISIGANSQDLWTVFYLKGEMCDKGYSKKDRPLVKPFDLRIKCNILVQLTALFPVCQSPPEIAMHALIERGNVLMVISALFI